MRALVVDDEPLARSRLIRMLQKIPSVESVAEADNGRNTLEQISIFNPTVVLLDIRMPGISGIEVARQTSSELAIIFTTAHDEHAVEAFEVAALDYLLKPIRQDRLEQALARVRDRAPTNRNDELDELDALYDRLLTVQSEELSLRITTRKGDSVRVFNPLEIDRLSSTKGYTSFQLGDEEFLIDESLSALEERLKPLGFMRVHRSELVRIEAIRALHSGTGGTTIELSSGEHAPVSRRQLSQLKLALRIKS